MVFQGAKQGSAGASLWNTSGPRPNTCLHSVLSRFRANHDNMHVHGYREKGGIDTPLGLTIQNQMDRFSVPIGDGGNPSPSGEARSSKVPEGARYPPTESQRFGAGEEWKVKSALG